MENENEKATAVPEATEDVEMETNDTTDAVAASEPQAETDRDTTTSTTTPSEEPETVVATTSQEEEKVAADESVAEKKSARSGCDCQGCCLVVCTQFFACLTVDSLPFTHRYSHHAVSFPIHGIF